MTTGAREEKATWYVQSHKDGHGGSEKEDQMGNRD